MSDIGRTVYNFHNQGRVLPLIRMRRHLTTEQAAFALIECTIATAISAFFLASLFLMNSSAIGDNLFFR